MAMFEKISFLFSTHSSNLKVNPSPLHLLVVCEVAEVVEWASSSSLLSGAIVIGFASADSEDERNLAATFRGPDFASTACLLLGKDAKVVLLAVTPPPFTFAGFESRLMDPRLLE